ncbi:exported hypothetical protein [Planktothrix paucivesiculata PCC 9631]|uniref:Membrane transporter protein n=1 Tax=Planktothrix paucivesiculata PCC 9631 TaxID=671071 RepID=A0A7Z9BSV9_9CYAN|nr:exported hypothetical protein [Planktothrix paucivesiculata PCC 9631]
MKRRISKFSILSGLTPKWSKLLACQQGLVMMAGTMMGGYMGAKYARQLKPKLMKKLITIIGYSITCYFFMLP